MASTLLSIPSANRISATPSSFGLRRCRRQCRPDGVCLRLPCVSSRAPSSNVVADMHVSSSIPASSLFHHVTKQLQKAVSVAALVVQILSPLPFGSSGEWLIPSAGAILYSPSTKIPRNAELALRKAIPGNSNMKSIQVSQSAIFFSRSNFLAMYILLPVVHYKPQRLTGRGMVEFTLKKSDDSKFSTATGGEQKSVATIQVVLDGYSVPLIAGNFAKLVLDGAYDGIKLKSANQAVISDNERASYDFSLPLEIMPSGQFEQLYRTMLDVQDGELPILPLSVYEAIAMSHSPDSDEYLLKKKLLEWIGSRSDPYMTPPKAGLGGLSFDEGQFFVFGYVTAGR